MTLRRQGVLQSAALRTGPDPLGPYGRARLDGYAAECLDIQHALRAGGAE